MFWETLWALVLGFALSGAVQAFVSQGRDAARAWATTGPAAVARGVGLRHGVVVAARTRRPRWRSRCSRRAPTSSPRWCSCSRRPTSSIELGIVLLDADGLAVRAPPSSSAGRS